MSLWHRMRTLVSAQSHHQLDRLEDPAVMAQQLVREIEDELAARRAGLVQMLVAAQALAREESQTSADLRRWEERARNQLRTDQESSAREALTRVLTLRERRDRIRTDAESRRQSASALRADIQMLERERADTLAQARLLALQPHPLGIPGQDGYTAMHDRRQRLERYRAVGHSDGLLTATELKAAEAGAVQSADIDAALAALREELASDLSTGVSA